MVDHIVLASSLNLRLAPQRDAGIVDSVPRYTLIEELDASDDSRTWLKVRVDGQVGWMSNSYLAPAELMELSWARRAATEFGVGEFAGAANNPRIQQYHASLGGRAGNHQDSVAWCSALANWCVEPDHATDTISRAARSWQRWGAELDEPRPGAIAVFWRRPSRNESAAQNGWSRDRLVRDGSYGHVAFLVEMLDGQAMLLGGNQSSRQNANGEVNKRAYATDGQNSGLLTLRWPG